MTKYREILRLKSLGLSQQSIADSCNVSKKTVNRVLKRAKEFGITWPLDKSDTDAVLQFRCYHFFELPYQNIMHVNAGDYRRADRSLSASFFCFFEFIAVHNPCFQHPSDKAEDIGGIDL